MFMYFIGGTSCANLVVHFNSPEIIIKSITTRNVDRISRQLAIKNSPPNSYVGVKFACFI